ncbi:hypothetical protein EBU71_13565 [bacterium]|nr:hypothetical protein [Candidatus Elulimicrobium humile]
MSLKKIIILISLLHISFINRHKRFKGIANDIIGDMLMGKVTLIDNNMLSVNLNARAKSLIREWYIMASFLHRKFKSKKSDLTVFRGVKNMAPHRNHYQPIPFSCCMNLSTAKEWIIPDKDNSFVMIIKVPKETLYTFIGNLEEGNEVILPAGSLILQSRTTIKDVNVVYYTFHQFNYGLQ